MDKTKITNIEIEGINHSDYPDYCDAFIVSAEIDGRELTEEELEELSNDSNFKGTPLKSDEKMNRFFNDLVKYIQNQKGYVILDENMLKEMEK